MENCKVQNKILDKSLFVDFLSKSNNDFFHMLVAIDLTKRLNRKKMCLFCDIYII